MINTSFVPVGNFYPSDTTTSNLTSSVQTSSSYSSSFDDPISDRRSVCCNGSSSSSNRPFCVGPLWDSDLTWHASHPDFPPCFHKTVLVLVPCAFLWMLMPLELYLNKISTKRGIPWSRINGLKLGLTLGLTLLSVLELAYYIYQVQNK